MTKLFLKYDKIFISVLIDSSPILFFPKINVGSLNLTLIFGLVKLLIPHRMSGDFLNKLNKLGINQATVFADLDGLCKHLEWMFFCERDEFIDRVK